MASLSDSALFMNIHVSSLLSDNVMRAQAKVPLSICGWIWIKLSSSPSFVNGYFWALDHVGMGMTHGQLSASIAGEITMPN